jgi:tetratricopeptide (TPR) repeat protein
MSVASTRCLRPLLGIAVVLFGCPDKPLDQARTLEKQGDKAAAAEAYFAAAKADRANLGAWDGAVRIWCQELAKIDRCLGVLDLELTTLGKLTRHQDHLSEALEKRARIRLTQGLTKSALMDLKRAQQAGPMRASVYVAQAKAYNALGVRHLALKALARARQLDPRNPEANEVAKQLPDEEGFGGEQAQPDTKAPKD